LSVNSNFLIRFPKERSAETYEKVFSEACFIENGVDGVENEWIQLSKNPMGLVISRKVATIEFNLRFFLLLLNRRPFRRAGNKK
jgi:hypothetical protein